MGEIFVVPGGDTGLANSNPNPAGSLFFAVSEAAIAPSPNEYFDLATHNDTLSRTGYLTTVSGSNVIWTTYITYQQAIASKMLGSWNVVGAGGQPPFLNNFSSPGSQPLRYRVTLLNELIIDGAIVNSGTPASGLAIVEFPASIQPAGGNRLYVVAFDGSAGFATIALAESSGRWYLSLNYTGSFAGAAYLQLPPIPLD